MGFDLSSLETSYILSDIFSKKNLVKAGKAASILTLAAIATFTPVKTNYNEQKILNKIEEQQKIRKALDEYHEILDTRKEKEELKKRINDKRIEDVVENAWNYLPRSRPYLEKIAQANKKYSYIFEVPIEYQIGLHMQESLYDSSILSFAGALGLGQMMRYTAEDLGMKVFDPKKFPQAYSNETKLTIYTKRLYTLSQAMKRNLEAEDFKSYLWYKHEREKTRKELFQTLAETKILYQKITPHDDDRLNPDIAIDLTAKHLAQLSKKMYDKFGGRKDHAVIRALAAYNSGGYAFENDGLPMIEETVKYVRIILRHSDKMYPGYD
ncbi:MAG TPA: transglycosylase SLT domain-containing protein [Alphaproteobacteria bacterium]|nr:transglycosylase SLT domain-containing protein [Alphaproteobacteria bacterium]